MEEKYLPPYAYLYYKIINNITILEKEKRFVNIKPLIRRVPTNPIHDLCLYQSLPILSKKGQNLIFLVPINRSKEIAEMFKMAFELMWKGADYL